jgi:NAD(P)-dependent dehydrogenase (short-subunit alcohol dehydrogenase family)
VQNLIESTVKAFGRIDIVINNAGIEKKSAFVDYPLEGLQKILAVNLIGPFLMSQWGARQNDPAGTGRPNHQHLVRSRRSSDADERGLLPIDD